MRSVLKAPFLLQSPPVTLANVIAALSSKMKFTNRWLMGGGALGNDTCKGWREAGKREVKLQCNSCNRGRSQSHGWSWDGPSELEQWGPTASGHWLWAALGSWHYLGQGSFFKGRVPGRMHLGIIGLQHSQQGVSWPYRCEWGLGDALWGPQHASGSLLEVERSKPCLLDS